MKSLLSNSYTNVHFKRKVKISPVTTDALSVSEFESVSESESESLDEDDIVVVLFVMVWVP